MIQAHQRGQAAEFAADADNGAEPGAGGLRHLRGLLTHWLAVTGRY